MKEWKNCTLGELGNIVGGATPSTKKFENYEGGTIPWITPKDLSGFLERYIAQGERNITEAGLRNCSAQLLPKHSILFSSRAPIGYIAIAACEVCTNQGFKSIIPNNDVDYMFLYYLLKFKKGEIENMGSGTTFKEVSAGVMKNIQVRVPAEKSVQIKIAKILSSLDDKIELNNRINDNLLTQAKVLFKAWFFDWIPFDRKMPDSWSVSTLGDVTDMGAGGDKPKTTSHLKTPACPYPIYSNSISDYGLYGYTDAPKIMNESVTVSARGTIGYVCLRHIPYVPIVRLVTLIPNTDILSAKYLYLFLSHRNITGTGTTQQQLTVPDFSKTEIPIPDKQIMTSFTEIVTPFFQQIWANEEENEKLTEVRDTLLPKLMSGELDVSELDI